MIIMQDEDGRKCDERCYDAKHMRCNCICGGANHGLGLQHALASVEDGGEIEDEEGTEE